jgi:hypothetical protein
VNHPVTAWKQITAGTRFTCALSSADRAYCWGANWDGQLGIGSPGASMAPVPVATGASAYGSELPAAADLTQIDSGTSTTCAMDTMSNVYCWGVGDQGQLGNGSTSDSNVPVKVLNLPTSSGALSIEVPTAAPPLDSTPAGGTVSVQLGEVTVRDTRGSGQDWTAAAGSSAFENNDAGPTITPGGTESPVKYTTGEFIDHEGEDAPVGVAIDKPFPGPADENGPGSEGALGPGATEYIKVATGGPDTSMAMWDPTITVHIPTEAPPDSEYKGTIYHAVY